MNAFKVIFKTKQGEKQEFEIALTSNDAIMKATMRLTLQHKFEDDFLNDIIGVDRVLLIPNSD